MTQAKSISILGSTGSIGTQALEVLSQLPEQFSINFLTVNSNIELLEKQINKFQPKGVVIADENAYREFKSKTSYKGNILTGEDGIIEAASHEDNKLVLSSLVGFAGVMPTLAALGKGIDVALANKETLVSAGSIISQTARDNNARIIAVDSEHNAILQCLIGEDESSIDKIILTASGGPFRELPYDKFEKITIKDALNHPNWSMGSKVTIDSATMMNKGFEYIEAYWLFKIAPDKIDILVHPQSIVHSMVEFSDGSIKAQLGLPDMKIPISYALTYPKRFKYDFKRLDLSAIGKLEFFKPDRLKFKCIDLAYKAVAVGGNLPAALNAANEIAVSEFLNGKIKFIDIPEIIETAMSKISKLSNPQIDDIIETDKEVRLKSAELASKMSMIYGLSS